LFVWSRENRRIEVSSPAKHTFFLSTLYNLLRLRAISLAMAHLGSVSRAKRTQIVFCLLV
jgi:hypothetical protein